MAITAPDLLVHASNILLLAAYSVRDILWLRWFAVAAALTNIPFFLLQETVLWPPVIWACVFTAINLAQIWYIHMQRRPVRLTDDEKRLHELGFQSIRSREFLALTMLGTWKDAQPGDRLLEMGLVPENVCIAIVGTVAMSRGDLAVGDLHPGQLIGVTITAIGEVSPVDARFTTPGRYITWPVAVLNTYLESRPNLRESVLSHVQRDIARKLYRRLAGHLG